MTMLSEVEAVINTRPLTYVYGDLDLFWPPSHFLADDLDIALPFSSNDCDDFE